MPDSANFTPEGYVTSAQAAAILRVVDSRVRQLRRAGVLEAIKVGRDYLISIASINKYIATPPRKGGRKNATKEG